MGDVVVGTCSWTDKTMIERWYPRGVSSAEARLRYYAARYDTVEVDSTFYGLPREDYARNWAERTPDGFTFHVKAYGLMTGHEVDERSLTPELREYDYEISHSGRVRRPEQRMVDRSFELFVDALTPLVEAGKMGGVLMQYPAYFTANDREHEHANLEHDRPRRRDSRPAAGLRRVPPLELGDRPATRAHHALPRRPQPHLRRGRRAADPRART